VYGRRTVLPVSSNGYNLSLFFSAATAAQGTPLSIVAKLGGWGDVASTKYYGSFVFQEFFASLTADVEVNFECPTDDIGYGIK
jgi:hypothetical protein